MICYICHSEIPEESKLYFFVYKKGPVCVRCHDDSSSRWEVLK